MAIAVQGTITIARKNGRNGPFNVGHLNTEIGEFEVKDSLIEEFDEGSYKGRFLIQWIEPDSFTWRGSVFVKNRATLAEVMIDEEEEAPAPSALVPPVTDPIDEKSTSATAPASTPDTSAAATATRPARAPATSDGNSQADPAKLFSEELQVAIMKRAHVKLDPTIERELFRKQRDALRGIGYAFDSKTQVWMPPANNVDDGVVVF